ncbi:MAG: helix-turn-helix transcriptional regulator, partial [Clostridia bacterium]|nr:helix-turn-helix transcriptional regulator [Clostridia bacterium]
DITISDIAKAFGYSKQHIVRLFKESFTLTPAKYILQSRLEKSLDLLSESRLAVNEIAEQCGFKDLNYFSRQFKKSYGISPTAYRKKLGRRV